MDLGDAVRRGAPNPFGLYTDAERAVLAKFRRRLLFGPDPKRYGRDQTNARTHPNREARPHSQTSSHTHSH